MPSPIVLLQTNLKSLRYGKDRSDLGDSNQPYITTPIPDSSDPRESGDNFEDFLWRGGTGAPLDTELDVTRLSRYFKDFKNVSGGLFAAKQNFLSKISVRTQASGVGTNDGIYTPLNTLAQAGINFIGGHIRKQGLIPGFSNARYSDLFVSPSSVKTFDNIFTPDPPGPEGLKIIGGENGVGNRLVQLTQIKIDNSLPFKNKYKRQNQIARFDWNILSYAGGPGSVLGIGGTRINFATDPQQSPLRTGRNNPLLTPETLTIGGMPTDFFTFRTGDFKGYNYAVAGYYGLGGVSSFLSDETLGNPFPFGNVDGNIVNLNRTDNGNGTFKVNGPVENLFSSTIYKSNDTQNPDFNIPLEEYQNKFLPFGKTGYLGSPIDSTKPRPLPLGASTNWNLLPGNKDLIKDKDGEVGFSLKEDRTIGFYQEFGTSVYKSGSLTPIPNLKSYQVGSPIETNGVNGIFNSLGEYTRGSTRINPIEKFIPPLGVSKLLGDLNIEAENVITIRNLFNNAMPAYHIGSQTGVWRTTDMVPSVYDKLDIGGKNPMSNNARMFDNGSFTLNTQQLQKKANESRVGGFQFPDFRATLIEQNGITKSSILTISPDYTDAKNKTIEGPADSRINYVSPGQKGNIISYTKGKFVNDSKTPSITDRINALPLYKSSNVAATKEGDAGGSKNDLVKFRIASIDSNDPSKKVYMHFRAYIDSFDDQYSANWNAQKYMGRGESFYKYDSFDRNVNLSFTVAAQSKPEIMVMYRKLNYLASNLAPDYTSAGFMSGPLVQLTLGGWCYELPGFISALTLSVPQESPWEIAINDEGNFDGTVKEMPHIVKVTGFSFKPIHTFRPAKMDLKNPMTSPQPNLADNNTYGDERYLALKSNNDNYDNEVNWYTK